MNKRCLQGVLGLIVLSILLIPSIVVQTGCANIIPPTGGPRDSIPPQLVKVLPGDSTTNFTGNRISFSFDEFIDVQNIQQNLLVSPTPKILPVVDYRLNTLTVRLRDTLESNTTYTLNFGEAIRDVNEGNVAKTFTYIFSTGPAIDSLELRGKVILAETGATDTTLIAMLHKNGEDSAVVNERPRYVARLDGNGNFIFKNLPGGTFYLYALKDDGGSRRYFDTKQLFAFADKSVVTTESNDSITLYAFAVRPATTRQTQQDPAKGRKPSRETDRLRWTTNLTGNELDLGQDLLLTFDQPLRGFDSSKVSLAIDSTFIPAPGYSLILDSSNKKLEVKYNWIQNTAYHLIVEKDFGEDTLGRKLFKTDTLSFKTRSTTDYGNLTLRLRNLDLTKNPVLLFMQAQEIKKSFRLTSENFTQALVFPGEYQLSILQDDNGNGKWDPGEFFGKHKQPELVKPIRRAIIVKAGQENEFEIAL